MKTENGSGEKVIYGARIIAFLLVAGGLLGILNSVFMGLHFAHQQQSLRVISAIISAALFAWAICMGDTDGRRSLAGDASRIQVGQTTACFAGSCVQYRSCLV